VISASLRFWRALVIIRDDSCQFVDRAFCNFRDMIQELTRIIT
jgi:hypothetical protein